MHHVTRSKNINILNFYQFLKIDEEVEFVIVMFWSLNVPVMMAAIWNIILFPDPPLITHIHIVKYHEPTSAIGSENNYSEV